MTRTTHETECAGITLKAFFLRSFAAIPLPGSGAPALF